MTALNVAVTERSFDRVVTQLPVPEHAPLQPVNAEPVAGVAVSVTVVFSGRSTAQVEPHWIPAGLLVTVPVPVPFFCTLRRRVSRAGFSAVPISTRTRHARRSRA